MLLLRKVKGISSFIVIMFFGIVYFIWLICVVMNDSWIGWRWVLNEMSDVVKMVIRVVVLVRMMEFWIKLM